MTEAAHTEIKYYWEDLPVGTTLDIASTTVDRDEVLAFASKYDPQPFHLDEAAAARSMFGKLAASGWHTCAMAMRMMCDDYVLDSASLGSPGIDNLRWLKPVFPGDTLSMRLTILAARPMNSRPGVGLVQSRWEVFNQQREAVLSMEGWGMYRMKKAAP